MTIGYSEAELFGQLKEELRQAAEECDKIAVHPFRGFIYDSMRKRLKIIERLCNEIGKYRDGDCRWFPLGMLMNQVHEKAGYWLRHTSSKDAKAKAIPLFQKLAENLRALQKQAHELEFKATGIIGSILPKPKKLPKTSTRVHGVRRPSGLVIPEGVKVS
jgi:hypothetical protein